MKLYLVTFPMADGPPRAGVFSAVQFSAFCEIWARLMVDGVLPENLKAGVATVEGDGPVDHEDIPAMLGLRRR